MPCYYPKYAKKSEEPNENGKYPLQFGFKGSQLDNDYMIPCGKCLGCRANQRRDWGIRMYHESLSHERNCMVTLTYDEEHIPQDGKINVNDVQKFIKRMRKKQKVRYFAAGEYGEKTRRPHYHVCIFGEDFRAVSHSVGKGMYSNAELERLWPMGNTSAINLDPSSCMYVAGYVTKKANDLDTFNLMSRRPPIGYQWLQDHKHILGNRELMTLEGRELPFPRVYFKWAHELDHIKGNYKKEETNLVVLRNREKNMKARMGLKQENI